MSMKKGWARWWSAWRALLLVWALFAAPAAPAHAQDCYVNGAFGMYFGAVSGSGRSATSMLQYTCSPDYSGRGRTFYYQLCVYIGPGDWSLGQATRRMSNYNGAYLHYDLFSDPAHTQLIGAPGSTPVYRVLTAVTPGMPQPAQAPVYGWVYPGQPVPAFATFMEQGIQGLLRYRYSSTTFPDSADCSSGGEGGATASFNSSGVLASYENSCKVAATDMDFGRVDPPQSPLYATASIRIECVPGTPWRVGLDNGQHFDGTTRRMAGPGGFVQYQLYLDESRTRVWGNAGVDMASSATDGIGSVPTLTVHGKLPPQPELETGSYSDTVIVTMYY